MKKKLSEWLPEEKIRGVVSSVPASYPSGILWPHGEWSLGWGKERPDGGGNDGEAWFVPDKAFEPFHQEGLADWLPLDLSDAANSTKRPRRGKNGITGFGQQMIKACGHLMVSEFPQQRNTLGTITLPPMSPDARRQVVEKWSDLTRELIRWLSRRVEKQGLRPVICSVTEVQPKRLTESGEGYLHWHALWPNLPARRGNWSVEPNDLRAWLDKLFRRHIPAYTGGCFNVDVKRVEGNAAAYLAKYMSKGKQQITEAMEDWGEDCCPRAWWNMTRDARLLVREHTHAGRYAGKCLEVMLGYARDTDLDEVYAFIRPVELEFDNSRIVIGWRGRFTPDGEAACRAMLNSR